MSRTIHRSLFAAALAAPLFATAAAHAAPQLPQVGTVDTTRYPDAVCNNGEAATYNYILSNDDGADGVDHRKKWLVVLSGGGGCGDYLHCALRWNEQPGGPNLDGGPGEHGNMVPDLIRRDFDGHGLLDFDGQEADDGVTIVGATANPFRGTTGADGFNRVWINYCSSDSWAGLGTEVAVDPRHFPSKGFDPTNPALTRLHFGGAKIVDAVIATIMRGEIGDPDQPRLDLVPDAVDGELVLAGSSAGGSGTIRNLDTVAGDIHAGLADEFAAAPAVKVWGIPDAATGVGPLPVPFGEGGYEAASFYTNGQPALVRTDDACVDDARHRCFAVGDHVVANEITTPYFVVQQAFDAQIHRQLKDAIAAFLVEYADELAARWPVLAAFAANVFATPEQAAEAYIRFMITTSADSIGDAQGNPAGLFIPNYDTGWHQLMADSKRFYTSMHDVWTVDDAQDPPPGSPRLGVLYAGTTVSIPTALASFRQCVLGNYAYDYDSCVATISLGDVAGNARVINTTAIPVQLLLP